MHGTDAYQRFKREGIGPLRDAEDLETTINMVASFAFGVMFRLHDYYMPEQKPAFVKWYVEEVRPFWAKFSPSPEIVAVVQSGSTGPAIGRARSAERSE